MTETGLERRSVSTELADRLRAEILDGVRAPGSALREVDLASAWRVSRHTVRAALRELEGSGVVVVERHRGARVAELDPAALVGLWEVRTALEVESARLALERNGGLLAAPVHEALAALLAATHHPGVSWSAVAAAHAALHTAIVEAAGSPRLAAEYRRLGTELELFLNQLRPVWPLEEMRRHHEELVAGLEREGVEALRRHLAEGALSLLDGS